MRRSAGKYRLRQPSQAGPPGEQCAGLGKHAFLHQAGEKTIDVLDAPFRGQFVSHRRPAGTSVAQFQGGNQQPARRRDPYHAVRQSAFHDIARNQPMAGSDRVTRRSLAGQARVLLKVGNRAPILMLLAGTIKLGSRRRRRVPGAGANRADKKPKQFPETGDSITKRSCLGWTEELSYV